MRDPVPRYFVAWLGNDSWNAYRYRRVLAERLFEAGQHIVKPVDGDEVDLTLAIEGGPDLLHNLFENVTVRPQQVERA